MRFDGNYGGAVNYEPNSFGGPVEDHRFKEPPFEISGDADRYDRYDQHPGDDDYTQAGNLFRLMTKDEQKRLFANTDRAMKGVPEEIKPITTNSCGSDQHMVRGRTTAPAGLVLGHEITGEVIECGSGVEFISKGDLVSVPFNIACGRCRNCKERRTDVCLNVNPARAGGAYGYVDMGGWVGGQAEYVMVPYADWNLLKFPDKDQALTKIRDLTCLSDILPTGYHGCVSAGVTTSSTVLISGAGPVGLAAPSAAFLLGPAVVIVADV